MSGTGEGTVEFTVGEENEGDGDQSSKGGLKPVRSVARFRVEFIGDDPGAPPETPAEADDLDDYQAYKDYQDYQDEHEDENYQEDDTVENLPLSKQGNKRVRVRPPSTSSNDRHSINSTNYDTKNLKTFGRNTLEALPHLDHYRNLLSATGALRKRPTLYELHDNEEEFADIDPNRSTTVPLEKPSEEISKSQGPKFGWVKGVLVRCLLNIWGVMLFLRLSWVVGQSGIGLAVVIILLATVVTCITSLSMSAICTNGEVKGGGAYYMISRSLGPEYGGAIGLIFSLANAVAVAMYVVGFAETIRDILKDHGRQIVDDINDVRIIGIVTVICLLGVVLVGMDWEARAQIGLLVILIIAIIDFIVGVFIPPTTSEKAKGFVGIKENVISENFMPDFRDGQGFFSVFAVFFPAATGILAGANISGDLKDAQAAIPKGTLLAILITSLTYILMAVMVGAVVKRDAYGPIIADISNSSMLQNDSLVIPSGVIFGVMNDNADNFTLNAIANQNNTMNCVPGSCKFGLQNDMQVMQLVSGWGPLIVAGIICATLSSALASLVGAPKVFQAVCKDRIFPGIHVFAKGYGKSNEPVRAYVLAFVIALACICIGSLNAIAPLISNFFLISYALINYSCFDASLAKSPGWRPAFKYYSMWLSLLGALLCLAVMFVINWWTALITLGVVTGLYLYVHYSKPEINWGSSTQAHQYRNALTSSLKLQYVEEHVKNFRPQTLVLTGHPMERPALVDFVNTFTKNISLMVCGHVLKQMDENESLKDMRHLKNDTLAMFRQRKVKAFYNPIIASNLRTGVQALMQCSGVGKMRPNILMLGFKSNWCSAKPEEVDEYFNIIHDAFDLHFGVGILHLREGFRVSHIVDTNDMDEDIDILISANVPSRASPSRNSSSATLDRFQVSEVVDGSSKMSFNAASETNLANFKNQPYLVATVSSNGTKHSLGSNESQEANDDPTEVTSVTLRVPQVKLSVDNGLSNGHVKGTIDVWWLFDDGGLTLLLPYLLTKKSHWKNCKLRIFSAASKASALDRDQRHMATLLSKFRINYHDMTIIPDVGKKPKAESLQNFEQLIKPWMLDTEAGETEESHPWKVSLVDISTQTERTHRHLRCRELLMEHSMDAQLIVMTLPMPRKGIVSSGLYMAYLDILTKGMPQILLLRGNQESVLTYYS